MKINNIGIYENLRKILNGGLFTEPISFHLEPKKNETVLDIGCGTGYYSQIVPGKYIGIDIDKNLIQYANNKYRLTNKSFLRGELQTLVKQKKIKKVDKAMIINVLHHLNHNEVDSLLKTLSKLVIKKIVIVDTDKGGANWFQKALYLLDDGNYIRSKLQLHQIICKHFNIQKELIFFSRTHSVRLCLFDCTPIK